MQWILTIHPIRSPTDTLSNRIPAEQAEIRCSDREVEEGKPDSSSWYNLIRFIFSVLSMLLEQ